MLSQGEILKNPSRTRLQRPPLEKTEKPGMWYKITNWLTCLIPNFFLRCFNMTDPVVQHAWREKVALCICIFFCWVILFFLTYCMNTLVCRGSQQYVMSKLGKAKFDQNIVVANGSLYYTNDVFPLENNTHMFKKSSSACRAAFGRQLVSGSNNPDKLNRISDIAWEWGDIMNKGMIVVDNKVYDPTYCDEQLFSEFNKKYAGSEGVSEFTPEQWQCYKDTFYAGVVAGKSPGCMVADVVFYFTTIAIFSLIIVKFFLSVLYSLYMKRKAPETPKRSPCILLVTCYSEGKEGIKNTLDSLCKQNYDYDSKLIVVISDGDIKGEGNEKTTPEIVLDLAEVDKNAEPMSYISLTHGVKRHNRAKVYAGYYNIKENDNIDGSYTESEQERAKKNLRTRILIINKCGNASEVSKPGNRGKRDSQVILMSFFSKLIYNDRLTELDYEIYRKIKTLMPHIEPDEFECMLMVDADTMVKPDALAKMVNVMESDPKVVAACGETTIINKFASWVTMIQVFEYYVSHHLTKSFESVFGGVTCLPGCFCIYRIKVVTDQDGKVVCKGQNHDIMNQDKKKHCLPILANPFIINAYSVYEAKTLHQKNLLHLGEDRYLTTLILKNFHKRKIVFIPSSKCATYVPDSFGVLLSQRRRWINSTIHNLFELVMVDNLCGTFCCSMRFVVVMELFGTLVLPMAIIFTFVMLAVSILFEPAWTPIIMLVGIFGLPAILIFFTTMEVSYLFWCIVYILSVPIWNLVLPLYAFWHFDDFSWGDTRKIIEKVCEVDEGDFDVTQVKMKELEDFLQNK